jgi:hypothetical protein
VISCFGSRFVPYRRAVAPVLVALSAGAFGCSGSNDHGATDPTVKTKTLKELVPPEQLYRWEGEGTAKRKVELDRRERAKLRREALEKEKAGSQ